MSDYLDEVNWDNVRDMTDTMKIVIYAEEDANKVYWKDGMPWIDGKPKSFANAARNWAEANPIIGGKPTEVFIVVGKADLSGNTEQLKIAFNDIASAKDQAGNSFVTEGAKMFVMGHASPGVSPAAQAGSGGYFGGASPEEWKNLITDAGLYDKFDTVAYGACAQGASESCVNLSYAFGLNTKVIAQAEQQWGAAATAAIYVNQQHGGDWTKTNYKNPADSDGTFEDAIFAVGMGQIETTGYDRKQTVHSKMASLPYKLYGGDPRLTDVGLGRPSIDPEKQATWDEAYELEMSAPWAIEAAENKPSVLERPGNPTIDPLTGEAMVETGNWAKHRAMAYQYLQQEYWDETYGIYDDEGNLTSYTKEPVYKSGGWVDGLNVSGRTFIEFGSERYGPEAGNMRGHYIEESKYDDWVNDKNKKLNTLKRLMSYESEEDIIAQPPLEGFYSNASSSEFYEEDGKNFVKLPDNTTEDHLDYMDLGDSGWEYNAEDNTVEITDLNIVYERDRFGDELPLFYSDNMQFEEDEAEMRILGDMQWDYQDWILDSRLSSQQAQVGEQRRSSEWDAYRVSQNLASRWEDQFETDVTSSLETQDITKPVPEWQESDMLLNSDDMVPDANYFVANPGRETDFIVNSMSGANDLKIDQRITGIWDQWEAGNPDALDAFNMASETLEGLGVEPNTAYWDKLIGLEALRLYAASDNQ